MNEKYPHIVSIPYVIERVARGNSWLREHGFEWRKDFEHSPGPISVKDHFGSRIPPPTYEWCFKDHATSLVFKLSI